MPEKWTGDLIGKMHNEGITLGQLAAEAGITQGYLSLILHGHKNPADGQERLEAAFFRLTARQEEQGGAQYAKVEEPDPEGDEGRER